MFSKVFVTWKKDYGEKIALKVCEILREYGLEYVFDEPGDCDLAVMVGGDGTLLKYQSSLECPILGINPGKSVGYYMSANGRDFAAKLKKMLEGDEGRDYSVKKFERLATSVNNTPTPFHALNEVLVSPVYVRRILDSDLKMRGKKTRERNSGILVYTPSGSNAYARSAGAKPLKASGFGIAAIAPYSGALKKGGISLSKGQVSIKCISPEGEMCVDGHEQQICRLKAGDVVIVKKSAKPARIVWFGK